MRRHRIALAAIALLAAGHLPAESPAQGKSFPLRDSSGLVLTKSKVESATFQGRKCVRLTVNGEDQDGLALLPATDLKDGVIEVELALKATTPPGVRYPGFIGIAFRAKADASRYDVFYLRPGNADAADQLMRNHVVQYVSEPGFGWYRLRREWPAVYESHADIAMEAWTKLRIEIAGRSAKVYLNGSSKPALVVDGLKGEELHGAVGLWGFTDEECYFSNLRITPAAPEDLKNGSDVAGSWEMAYASDAGRMNAVMDLRRDGTNVSGSWSGPLGESCVVTGTWRNGYVELSFAGTWPKESRQGEPGPVQAKLAGWIDGDAGKGRMRVEGRSDGAWVAKRKS